MTVEGRTFKAVWFDAERRTTAGSRNSRTWISDDVPGRLLKSATRYPAADTTVTVELIEYAGPGPAGPSR